MRGDTGKYTITVSLTCSKFNDFVRANLNGTDDEANLEMPKTVRGDTSKYTITVSLTCSKFNDFTLLG